MESMVLGNGEVKTEETEDDSNMYGADFEYKNVKVELDDAAIKAELTEDDMCSADFDYKDVKVEFHGGEVKAEITDVCSANFDYKDIKFEPDNETVKAETTDDYSNMRSADLENKDFQLGHEELHIKDDGGTSSEALESDLNRTSSGMEEHLCNPSCDANTCNEEFTTTASLNNLESIKRPDFEESAPSSYKTLNSHLSRSMSVSKGERGYKLSTCIHCDATFRSNISLDDHIIRKHPEFLSTVSSRIHGCTHCAYKTTLKSHISRHMVLHSVGERRLKLSTCIHCNAVFRSNASLDDHIIRKHPEFLSSVSSKIHECTHCSYKTISKSHLAGHMLKHSLGGGSDNKSVKCIHCNATFRSNLSLDDHIIKKHPEFEPTCSSKIHECILCTYKTALKNHLSRHVRLLHSMEERSYTLSVCIHCDATFKSNASRDDHIIRIHPEFSSSVSSKIHECTHCTYKTISKSHFTVHMLKHSVGERSHIEPVTCVHCNAPFRFELTLHKHIIKEHPEFLASVSSKLHECTFCAYKSSSKKLLAGHMLKHSVERSNNKLFICIHCNTTFKSNRSLDDHIIKKHPEFVSCVSSKMFECTHCTYKTTLKTSLAGHMLKHSVRERKHDKLFTCIHCNAKFTSNQNLDDHIIRTHPECLSSVSSKIHDCTHCTYKTTLKSKLAGHVLKHSA